MYRRVGWGVCRLCWRNHVEKNADVEMTYHTKWTPELMEQSNQEDDEWHAKPAAVPHKALPAGAATMLAAVPHDGQLGLPDKAERGEVGAAGQAARDRAAPNAAADAPLPTGPDMKNLPKSFHAVPPPPQMAIGAMSRTTSSSSAPKEQEHEPRARAPARAVRSRSPEPERPQLRRGQKRSDMRGMKLTDAPTVRDELKALSNQDIRQLVIDCMDELTDRAERWTDL